MANVNYGAADLNTTGIAYVGGLVITGSTPLDAAKVNHEHVKTYAQPNTTATTERKTIHTCRGAGTILAFRAGSVVACIGAATISIRLKKNGTNIDTAALVLDSGNTAFIFENAAGFTSTAVAAGDVLEVDVTATAGGGTLGTGLFCELTTVEAY